MLVASRVVKKVVLKVVKLVVLLDNSLAVEKVVGMVAKMAEK
jgi:hypothetical protein